MSKAASEEKNATPSTDQSGEAPKPTAGGWGFKQWAGLYAAIFIVLQIAIISLVNKGGESRSQLDMLGRSDAATEAGDYAKSLEILNEFGEMWPGALETQNFNRKLGNLHYNLGEYEEAENFFAKSIEFDRKNPKVPGGWAAQGRAVWEQERIDEAAQLFQTELQQGNRRSDIALGYLGLYFYEKENYVKAFEFFSAVRDPSELDFEIDAYRQEFEDLFLRPPSESVAESSPAEDPAPVSE